MIPINYRFKTKKSKYNAKKTEIDGIKFDSAKEANYYAQLKQRSMPGGDINFFLQQVPIRLPGGTKYVVDFLEFHCDGTVHFVDVKGMITEVFKVKKREVEAVYPFEIETV